MPKETSPSAWAIPNPPTSARLKPIRTRSSVLLTAVLLLPRPSSWSRADCNGYRRRVAAGVGFRRHRQPQVGRQIVDAVAIADSRRGFLEGRSAKGGEGGLRGDRPVRVPGDPHDVGVQQADLEVGDGDGLAGAVVEIGGRNADVPAARLPCRVCPPGAGGAVDQL